MENKFLDRNGVSHFYLLIKNKLTSYFKTLFVSKKDGYDLSQNDFTNELKSKLENMNGADLSGAVRYDTAQELTEKQKAQARANIGAGTSDITESGEGAVRYDVKQILDDDDKTRARENIGAGTSNFDGDYNNLSNRPFYGEAFHSFFDGNETPNPDYINVLNLDWYKVSDLTPTKEQLETASIYFDGILNFKLTDEYIVSTGEKDGEITYIMYSWGENTRHIAVVYTTAIIEGEIQGTPFSFTPLSEGIYWLLSSGVANKTFEIEYGEIKKLDDMYIPRNIPRLNKDNTLSAKNLPLIPAEKLPSYVDDVVEGYLNFGPFGDTGVFHESYSKDESGTEHWGVTIEPEKGKIYIDLIEGNSYRWSGSQYVKIESSAGLTALTNTEIDEIIASVDSSTE